MDASLFYATVRESLFGNRLSQSQVDGMNALFDMWREEGIKSLDALSYVLASSFRETGGRMVPVLETFAKTRRGGAENLERAFVAGQLKWVRKRYWLPDPETGLIYIGGGHIQLTHRYNYAGRVGQLVRQRFGVDLEANPDAILRMDVSAYVCVVGMVHGLFTGKKLSDFMGDKEADFVGARAIVNGSERASLIAGYAEQFRTALVLAGYRPDVYPQGYAANSSGVVAGVVTGKPMVKSTTNWATAGQLAATTVASLGALDWKVAVPLVITSAALAFWIIRERRQKATNLGI